MLINDFSTIVTEVPVRSGRRILTWVSAGILIYYRRIIGYMSWISSQGQKGKSILRLLHNYFYMPLVYLSGPVFRWTGLDAHGSMILSTTSSIQKMPRSDFHVQSGDQIRKRKQLHLEGSTTRFWKILRGFEYYKC